jgi:hypothetical protein
MVEKNNHPQSETCRRTEKYNDRRNNRVGGSNKKEEKKNVENKQNFSRTANHCGLFVYFFLSDLRKINVSLFNF